MLTVDCVFVGQALETAPAMERTIACWKDGRVVDNVAYPARSTPYRERQPWYVYSHRLIDLDGASLGHIGVASRRRFRSERKISITLARCAPRIAGELERLRRERDAEILLREMHHRVKNNLQVVASLLAMQTDAASDAVVRKALSDAAMRISTIALIHAQLSEAPTGASVHMGAFVHQLVANMRRTLAGSRTGVSTTLFIEPLTLHLQFAIPCALLISELVTNAFQHAFVDVDEGVIDVRLTVRGRDATLIVRDNGVGLPRDAERGDAKGMGLRLVRLLATRQLRGRLSFSRRNGTQVSVSFPLTSGIRPIPVRRPSRARSGKR
jgi:two-component sensor histidine kinase